MARSLALLIACLLALPAQAWEASARLEAEARWFFQLEEGALAPSAAAGLEIFHDWNGGQDRLVGEFFGRVDEQDDARTHADVRELYLQSIGPEFEASVGLRRLFWGVTESRHLVDIINQSDLVEDLDAEQKLGQPLISGTLIRDWASLDLILMPYQRARTFPGPEGHPRLPFPVAAEEARYQSLRGQNHLDGALRIRHSSGGLDLGLAYFNGTAREPMILPCLRRGSGFQGTEEQANCDIFSGIIVPQSPLPEDLTPLLQALGLAPSDEAAAAQIREEVLRNIVLVPSYARLRQYSVDAQYVTGGWALKLEAVARELGGEHSVATVSGFEYSLGDITGRGWDIGLLAEYLYDQRRDLLSRRFDHDVFLGTRVSLNDVAGTLVLAGFLFDESGDDHLLQIEASRRLGDGWKLSGKFRLFEKTGDDPFTGFLADEDMLSLTLERYF